MSEGKQTRPLGTGVGFNRRHLMMGGVGAAWLGVFGVGGSFLYHSPARLIERIVRNHLPGLEISEEGMAGFVADFIAADSDTSSSEWVALRLMGPFTNLPPFRWMVPGFISHRLENYERRVMNEFMMASDFFDTYAKGNSKVEYFGIYSVYEAPCASPLPRFPDEADIS